MGRLHGAREWTTRSRVLPIGIGAGWWRGTQDDFTHRWHLSPGGREEPNRVADGVHPQKFGQGAITATHNPVVILRSMLTVCEKCVSCRRRTQDSKIIVVHDGT